LSALGGTFLLIWTNQIWQNIVGYFLALDSILAFYELYLKNKYGFDDLDASFWLSLTITITTPVLSIFVLAAKPQQLYPIRSEFSTDAG
jgi:hypothetical protein